MFRVPHCCPGQSQCPWLMSFPGLPSCSAPLFVSGMKAAMLVRPFTDWPPLSNLAFSVAAPQLLPFSWVRESQCCLAFSCLRAFAWLPDPHFHPVDSHCPDLFRNSSLNLPSGLDPFSVPYACVFLSITALVQLSKDSPVSFLLYCGALTKCQVLVKCFTHTVCFNPCSHPVREEIEAQGV